MEILAGRITHYFNRISVAVVSLKCELKPGDTIHVVGRNTEFTQQVSSMEIEHRRIFAAGAGTEIALRVMEPVYKGDCIFKVVEGQPETQH